MNLTNKDFIHLHSHDEYSIMDSVGKVEGYYNKSEELGFEGFAITNHGSIGGWVRQIKKNNEKKIRSIFGCELYLNQKRLLLSQLQEDILKVKRKDKNEKLQELIKEREKIRKNFHLTLLVKNSIGWKNLLEITADSWLNGFYYKPRTDLDFISKHSEGLICLSGCASSRLSKLLSQDKVKKAKKLLYKYKDIFEDFYIELMLFDYPESIESNKLLYKFAKDYDIPFVITNDCHYINKLESKVHQFLLLLRNKNTLNDLENNKGFSFSTKTLWFKTVDELYKIYKKYHSSYLSEKDWEAGIKESKNIFENVEDFKPELKNKLPFFTDSSKSDFEFLKKEIIKNWNKAEFKNNDTYKNQLQTELKIVKERKLSSYFLILADLINFAKNKNIFVGPGRGSASGSLICYLLGITIIDPIKFGLKFERFISAERTEPPDVDLDFEPAGRDYVKKYLSKRWGQNNVIEIGTYQTYSVKVLLLDLARLFQLDMKKVSKITEYKFKYTGGGDSRRLQIEFENTWEELMTITKHPDIMRRIENKYKDVPLAFDTLKGQIKGISRHAAGIIILSSPITKNIALMLSQGKPITAWSEGGLRQELSSLGFVKFDLLAINTLRVIKETLGFIDSSFDLNNIRLDDKKVFKNVRKKHTTGIFQFESRMMTKLLSDIQCSSFEELIAAIALGRPGPMSYGMVDLFVNRKSEESKYKVPPFLKDTLSSTYGLILYQEQMLEIYKKIVHKIESNEIEGFRKVFLKRRLDKLQIYDKLKKELKAKFFKYGKENLTEKEIERLWNDMNHFSAYTFNRAHAVAYSLVSYWTAYLKTYFPLEFMVSLMRNEKDDSAKYINECKRLGIKVLPVRINRSKINFKIENGNIRSGISSIKGIGTKAAIDIYKNQPFENEEDFFNKVTKRIVNKRVVEALKNANAFRF